MHKILSACLLIGLAASATAAEQTLFNVNGAPVTRAMLQHMAKDMIKPGVEPNEQIQQILISELANRILLSQAAVTDGLDQRPEHRAGLEVERISYLANAVLQEQMRKFKPSDADLQALYKEKHSQPRQEFKARHILLKEKEQAQKLIKELDAGADFAELAKQHSTGPTGAKGGDLGWFSAETMVKPFADALGGMDKGSYSKQPVQTPFGWHLILLEDSRELPAKPLDQVKDELTNQLRQQALKDYMLQLRAKAVIEQAKP
ncbi:MAG: peptidylprolyl isomerase [Gammaproteobacteria bacterium SHHR-1]|uniref:peptidylprolyl isomerase n=1 Tax=Magnetovirga frankeli TaxID=947516 RepID=UPI001292E546|nr:peptidylprolyl isomerase [gamma proteobacterium SS-5]